MNKTIRPSESGMDFEVVETGLAMSNDKGWVKRMLELDDGGCVSAGDLFLNYPCEYSETCKSYSVEKKVCQGSSAGRIDCNHYISRKEQEINQHMNWGVE